jgi:hypothetical protein
MGWKGLAWLIAIGLFVLKMISLAIRAFSEPWTGTSDQLLLGFFTLCVLTVVGVLAAVWQRHGLAELQRRFRAAPGLYRAYDERPGAGKARFGNLLIWIIVALALVVVFQFQQHR